MRISDCSSDVCSSDLKRLFPKDRRPGKDFRALPANREPTISSKRRAPAHYELGQSLDGEERSQMRSPKSEPSQARSARRFALPPSGDPRWRSEEHTSELQSLIRTSYTAFCLNKQNKHRPV